MRKNKSAARAEIRPAVPADIAAIRTVERVAFGHDDEARLVDRLREDGDAVVELVATVGGGVVVGHVLFSHLPIWSDDKVAHAAALAPLAVLPQHRRAGIGSALVKVGLAACAEQGLVGVVVVGDPGFYGRFGFSSASARYVRAPYAGESFMALELTPGALRGGEARYPRAFASL
ncbi:MAG TPA: N-acetyltransferase [Alphaproteobacteria bacterium]|nr:N-acetyltransferase [Alphaproteobacteria bacterium]